MSLCRETREKIEQSIEMIRASGNDYTLAFSGGKDSLALDFVASLSGVHYHRIYNLTTVDPPELVRLVKAFGAQFRKPELSM